MKYWIGVASKDHVARGISLSIAQIGHGKRSGLARMQAGDRLVYYSPKENLGGSTPLQAFTAIGKVADDTIWQADEGGFKPYRRRVIYNNADEASIRPLLDKLSFTQGKANWGYSFRYGLLEITKQDYDAIAQAMKVIDGQDTTSD